MAPWCEELRKAEERLLARSGLRRRTWPRDGQPRNQSPLPWREMQGRPWGFVVAYSQSREGELGREKPSPVWLFFHTKKKIRQVTHIARAKQRVPATPFHSWVSATIWVPSQKAKAEREQLEPVCPCWTKAAPGTRTWKKNGKRFWVCWLCWNLRLRRFRRVHLFPTSYSETLQLSSLNF